ncbi:hypothetical protein [Neptunicella marina]|uniref:Uncharacterized protein n=1 Tax=Neptunicella marina TaxID=2125989 RepID=A0A8J6IRV5_9ALTE|nr:hypothetical protein [Neptunicella marina]MBC3764702.1 hypothetical protein [Neptunicella marina]
MKKTMTLFLLMLSALSLHANATQCPEGKHSIQQSALKDLPLAQRLINSDACFVNSNQGELVPSVDAVNDVMKAYFNADHQRKLTPQAAMAMLATLTQQYDIALSNNCSVPGYEKAFPACAQQLALTFKLPSAISIDGISYVHMSLEQFIQL